MTRGAVTTFSIANDVAKYFAIMPVLFASAAPALASLKYTQSWFADCCTFSIDF